MRASTKKRKVREGGKQGRETRGSEIRGLEGSEEELSTRAKAAKGLVEKYMGQLMI